MKTLLNEIEIQVLAQKANLRYLNVESYCKFANLVLEEAKRRGVVTYPSKVAERTLSGYVKGTRVKILQGVLKDDLGTIVDDQWALNYDKDSDDWRFRVCMDEGGYEYTIRMPNLEIIEERTPMNDMTMRDQFAAAAVSGCYALFMDKLVNDGASAEQASIVVALEAYSMADAMLTARG